MSIVKYPRGESPFFFMIFIKDYFVLTYFRLCNFPRADSFYYFAVET